MVGAEASFRLNTWCHWHAVGGCYFLHDFVQRRRAIGKLHQPAFSISEIHPFDESPLRWCSPCPVWRASMGNLRSKRSGTGHRSGSF